MKNHLLALALLSCIVGGATAQTASLLGRGFPGNRYIAVDYADSVQGVLAMFAVRACVSEDGSPLERPAAGDIRPQGSSLSRLVERQVAVDHDIVVRVVDRDGSEVSRHEGANDVCGFARLASAFLSADRPPASGSAE